MKRCRVMIIEDDFRIANIHMEMIEENPLCEVIASSRTAKEALEELQQIGEMLPDVILLDVYIPDVVGLELLTTLKEKYPYIAIIIASAANDMDTFRKARLIGVYDYLTKPIDKQRLQFTLQRFIDFMSYSANELSQREIDEMVIAPNKNDGPDLADGSVLPKGIDSLTLIEVKSFLEADKQRSITAQTLGESLGISRATARRYLEYLVVIEWLEASLHYGQVGRPQRIYTVCEQYEQN